MIKSVGLQKVYYTLEHQKLSTFFPWIKSLDERAMWVYSSILRCKKSAMCFFCLWTKYRLTKILNRFKFCMAMCIDLTWTRLVSKQNWWLHFSEKKLWGLPVKQIINIFENHLYSNTVILQIYNFVFLSCWLPVA